MKFGLKFSARQNASSVAAMLEGVRTRVITCMMVPNRDVPGFSGFKAEQGRPTGHVFT